MEQNIDAGALNKRVTLLRRGVTGDSFADPLPDAWEETATVWAAINNAGAKEYWEAHAAHGELTHKITIRFRRGVSAGMRARYGDRFFEVIAPPVDYDERHKYLVLKCREIAGTLYTPHTVTLYNAREDPASFETSVYITLLPGVLLESATGARAAAGKQTGTDAASLWIPYGVAARDALSGKARNYAGPREYAASADRSALWTLDPNADFFCLGEVVDATGDFQAINAAHDNVFRVTKAALVDAGDKALWHFEVEGA